MGRAVPDPTSCNFRKAALATCQDSTKEPTLLVEVWVSQPRCCEQGRKCSHYSSERGFKPDQDSAMNTGKKRNMNKCVTPQLP